MASKSLIKFFVLVLLLLRNQGQIYTLSRHVAGELEDKKMAFTFNTAFGKESHFRQYFLSWSKNFRLTQ